MTAIEVELRFDTPCVGIDRHPVMLDGPLAWAAAQDALRRGDELPAITDEYAHDFDLPLARWEEAGTWGWCTSRAIFEVGSRSSRERRRKPAVQAMAAYAPDRKHHAGLGPFKARDATYATTWTPTMRWQVEATDVDRLAGLLLLVTHIGAAQSDGMGHVKDRIIRPGIHDGWRDRPMPPHHPARAPYWHPTRRVA